MKLRLKALACLSVSTLPLAVALAEPATPATAPSVTTEADTALTHDAAPAAREPLTAAAAIDTLKEDWLKSKSLSEGTDNPHGAYVGWATAAVSIQAIDARWGNARYNAYELAIAKAEADFVEYQSLVIATETATHVFNDPLGTAVPKKPTEKDLTQCEQDVRAEVERKALALTNAELDARLRTYGIDPAQFSGKPQPEKAKLYSRTFWKKTVTTATGSLAGVRTLQTFEGVGEDGNWRMGALIVHTPRMAALARAIADGSASPRGLLPPDAPVKDQVTDSPVNMLMDFGVRTLVDEHGDPCIIAFGQSAIPTGVANPAAREMMADGAVEVARRLAQSAISEFANGVVEASGGLTLGESYDVDKSGVEQAAYFQQLNTNFSRSSSVHISGLTTVKTFRAKHPKSGQEFVGVVLAWSPTSQQQAHRAAEAPAADAGGRDPKVGAGATKGHDFDKHLKDW